MTIALFLLMAALAIALLAIPFLRHQAAPDRRDFDLTVHQDQLAELERDLDRGIIGPEAARAARLEIERRILAVAEGSDTSLDNKNRSQPAARLAAALVLIVPLASGYLYVKLGRPHLPDLPLASREAPEQQLSERDALLANIEEMEKHLEAAPENGGVWMMLGRTRLRAGQYQEAVEALSKGVEFSPDDPSNRAELAEAMVYAAGGQVTPAALDHFKATLEQIPNEPRSRYYLGMALAQEGEIDAAIDGWAHLLEASPSDAPWRFQIVEAIRSMLEGEGRPADGVIASLPPGTPPSQASAASGDGENEQVRGMVEGLAARLEDEPDDIEGWLMLGRSRMVLEEPELARQAFERAMELAPERPEVLLGYAASLLQPSETPGGDPVVSDEAVELYEKLVTLAPDDPEPRWLLGVAAAQAGNKDEAVGHWQDLLGLIEEGSEDHRIVKARIAALEGNEPAAGIAAGAAPSLAPGGGTATAGAAGTASTGAQALTGGATTAKSARPGSEPASPGSGPGPTAEDRAAMATLTPDERNTQIRSMVDGLAARLEENPNDIEGWLRLGQSRLVLGEPESAKEAYRRAMEAEPDNPEILRIYASSLLGEPHPETDVATVGEDAVDLYEKIIELKPDDSEAHWYLGLAAVQKGTIDDAKTHWKRVLDLLGPDHPNYAAVQSSLEQVETKTQ